MNFEGQLNFPQFLTLLAAFQALQLGAISIFRKKKNPGANRIFAVTMLILALLLLMATRRFSGLPLAQPPYWVVHCWGALALLVSPLIYLYVRKSIDSRFKLGGVGLLHFLPATIHLLFLLPILIADPETRASLVRMYLDQRLFRSLLPGVPLGFIQASIYFLLSFWWVRKLEAHVKETASFTDELQIRWLKWYTTLLVLLLILLLAGQFFGGVGEPNWTTALAVLAFLTAVLLTSSIQPELFHGIPTALELQGASSEGEAKYSKSKLDEERKQSYMERLMRFFEEERPYLQPELTLADVSDALKISPKALSQVINEKLGKNFLDFVNGYRVEIAKSMLIDPDRRHLSVLGVALDAGFNSKSAFYKAFKQKTGTTPTAFRKSRLG